MKRFSRGDWLEVGLDALIEDGLAGITIDGLCARTGKTKGSFYAHFASAADFAEQLALHWETRNTEHVIERVGDGQPEKRRELLDELALGLNHTLERNMRLLAASQDVLAVIVRRVDARRIDHLAQHYRLRFDAADSLALARMEYALFVAYQMGLGVQETDFADSYARFLRIIGM